MSNTLCRWVSTKLSTPPTEYLLEHEKQIIDEHLKECFHCSELQSIATVMNQWTALEAPEVSQFVEKKIITSALEGRMPRKTKVRFWTGHFSPLIATAAMAVAVTIAVLVYFAGGSVNMEQTVSEVKLQPQNTVTPLETHQKYNLVHFEKATPVKLMREDKVWGTEQAIVNLQVLSNKLTRIELIQGKIVVEVTKRANGDKFEVVGPSGTVEVVGTVFSVEVDDTGRQHVRVLEGTVKVQDRRKGVVTSVPHNRQITIGAVDTIAASRIALESDRDLMKPVALEDERSQLRVRRAKSLTGQRAGKQTARTNAATLASKAIDEKRLVEAKRHIATVRQSSDQGQDVPNLYARLARAYRQQKNYAAAKGTYEQLISDYGNSRAAQNARVGLAQLELNALGNAQAALRHFNDYLNNVPSGYLSEAAWVGKARSQYKLGSKKELIQTSNAYLANYRNGAFAAEMLLYRGQIRAQAGKCRLAQKDYKTVISKWPNSKKAKEAQEGLIECGAN